MSYKEKLIARAFLNLYIECTVDKSKVLHFYRQSVDLLKTPRKKVRTSMDIPEIVNSLKKKKEYNLFFILSLLPTFLFILSLVIILFSF